MTDQQGDTSSHQRADGVGAVQFLPFGFLGRAYLVSARHRRFFQIELLFWGLVLFGAAVAARFEAIGAWTLLATMASVFLIRSVVVKIYLVAMRVPAIEMPMSQRARFAFDGVRHRLSGAVRTLSIIAGIAFIVISAMIVADGKLFSYAGIGVTAGLLIIFAAAVILDVFVHKYYSKR